MSYGRAGAQAAAETATGITHGHAATRVEAMAAFAKSWRRRG